MMIAHLEKRGMRHGVSHVSAVKAGSGGDTAGAALARNAHPSAVVCAQFGNAVEVALALQAEQRIALSGVFLFEVHSI